ncbi:MAG: hypothetical protein FXF47_01200 [Candidatus Mcinerneyibacterium aminivorans]|uniref:tRNA pseudouridine(55) synthase n=1 Tax=Candidatus Mcinerneyibacterium aminivorans TaxID=2703815 RepID=A0A5D0ME12_9BACT|nr:MAG: hypothetical protein FXF47_01200 [Candidatus Mcinerneyibacterium aminivorans]
MNGVLLVEKPAKFTSFDCVEKVKNILKNKEKVGHAGNLAPFCSGVLPIMIGKATKLFEVLIKNERTYIGEYRLGIETDTWDSNGKVITSNKNIQVEESSIMKSFKVYQGGYLQKNYFNENDRKEKKAEIEHFVELHNVEILNIQDDSVLFLIEIGKDFDIKSYLRDVSLHLGTKGVLYSLKRIKFGRFKLKDSVVLDEIKKIDDIKNNLINIKNATSHMSTIKVNEKIKRRVLNGNKLNLKMFDNIYGFTRILSRREKVLAIGRVENGKFDYISVLGEVV